MLLSSLVTKWRDCSSIYENLPLFEGDKFYELPGSMEQIVFKGTESLVTNFNTNSQQVMVFEDKRCVDLEKKMKGAEMVKDFSDFYKSFYGSISKKRYALPWRINNWEICFKLNLVELTTAANASNGKDRDKKDANKAVKKMTSKLHKILTYEDRTDDKTYKNSFIDAFRIRTDIDCQLVDLKPTFPFCVDGTERTLRQIFAKIETYLPKKPLIKTKKPPTKFAAQETPAKSPKKSPTKGLDVSPVGDKGKIIDTPLLPRKNKEELTEDKPLDGPDELQDCQVQAESSEKPESPEKAQEEWDWVIDESVKLGMAKEAGYWID